MRRTAYMQNGSTSLFDNTRFCLKRPEIWYIFKTCKKAWLVIFNWYCTFEKKIAQKLHLIKCLCKTPRKIFNAGMLSSTHDEILVWKGKINLTSNQMIQHMLKWDLRFFKEPLYMTREILIPSNTYSRKVAMIFSKVKEIWHDVNNTLTWAV